MSDVNISHPNMDRLIAYHSGQLDDVAAAEIGAHLRACSACRDMLGEHSVDTMPPSMQSPDSTLMNTLAGDSAAGERPSFPTLPALQSGRFEIASPLPDHARYRVLKLLGSGGMGAVYKAEHRLMERIVALKVINSSLIDNPAAIERFRLEVKAAARLTHPNIVTAFDAEQAGNVHFLVMEYVEGISLAQLVQERGQLPIAHACEYARQAAFGLQHAFEQGMVHRDIKPQNLMLSTAGRVKILDFGLARFVSESSKATNLTGTGAFMGTPDYIAPEQATDAHRADTRADIYSLGCTLYDLLTGRPPFPEGSTIQKVMAHIDQAPRPVRQLRPDVPPELDLLVTRMMAKDPAQRFQTPKEVAQALTPFCRTVAAAMDEMHPSTSDHTLPIGALTLNEPADPDAARELPKALAPRSTEKITTNSAEGLGRSPAEKALPRKSRVLSWLVAAALVAALSLGAFATYRVTRDRDGISHGTQAVLEAGTTKADDNQLLASGGQEDTSRKPQSVKAPGLIRSFEHPAEVWSVALSLDGSQFLSGGLDHVLRLWETNTGKELARLEGHTGAIESVAISPDGRRALSGSAEPDRTMRLWDLDSRKELRRFRGHTTDITSVAFSPDGRRALSCGAQPDAVVRVWELDTGKEVQHFDGHKRTISGAFFLPGGRRAISGSWDSTFRIWNPEDGREVRRFAERTTAIRSLAVSHHGRWLMTGNADKTLRLWDLIDRKELQCLNGHSERILSVAFSPDDRRALSGSTDKTMRLWDLDKGLELANFDGHGRAVRAVAFFPDGRHALSASLDGTVRLWRLPTPDQTEKPVVIAKAGDGAGQLVVNTHDAGLLLNIKKQGRVVVSRTSSRLLDLQPGEYEVELVEPNPFIRVSKKRFSVSSEFQATVEIGPAQLEWPVQLLQSGLIAAPEITKTRLLFHDEFNNPRSGFLRQHFPTSEFDYENGKYRIRLLEGTNVGVANIAKSKRSEMVYQAVGRVVSPASAGWGLTISNHEEKRGIAVRVNYDGTLEVGPSPAEFQKFRGPHVGPIHHSAIKHGSGFQSLLVVVRGRLVEVYVNGVAVCNPIVVDRDFTPASAALAAFGREHGALVEFKSVTGWSANELPMPQSRGATFK